AVVSKNRPEFIEAYQAAMRSGIRFTPVNFHLTGEEVGYVLDNCEAKAVVYDVDLGTAAEAIEHAPKCELKLAVGGPIEGFTDYDGALDGLSAENIENPVRGSQMLYTSGTTGRPKGVYRQPGAGALGMGPRAGGGGGQAQQGLAGSMSAAAWNPETDRALCTGPGYHAAPLAFNITAPLAMGVGVVMMDRWDAEETLKLIEEYRITHTHMVATMFHRLLKLPEEVRNKYDVSSLRVLLHGAAPCPVHTKHAIIEWFGPIVFEYYAATEGGGGYFIDTETWLQKPGTVGRAPTP
ncbi:MAG: AMP-binding protein, partial [Gammaproteobacteria bacterium]